MTRAICTAYWNALLANRFGQEWAAEFTTAHERVRPAPDRHASSEAMDLHNNEVGRRIADEHPEAGPDELARHVEAAVRNGEMVVVGPDGRLVRSDEVPFGGTEEATDPAGQGGPDPVTGDRYDDSSGGYHPGGDGGSGGTYDN